MQAVKTSTRQLDILDRVFDFSLKIMSLCREIEKDSIGRLLVKQLLLSGTSIGANLHEAQGAQSKADFIAKVSIPQKESLETLYWLKLLQRLTSHPQNTYLSS